MFGVLEDREPSSRWIAYGAALVCLGAFVALTIVDANAGTLRAGEVPTTIVWYVVAFVGFLLAVVLNERTPLPMRSIWLFAIAFRLVLLFTTPTLSDDVYRYLWEGHLVSEWVSPYDFPIQAAELDPYDIPARDLVNNPDLASPYLPTAHAVFGLSALLFPSEPAVMQILMTVLDLAFVGLLIKLLRHVGQAPSRVLLYAWNPLAVVEIAHGAHIDGLMMSLTGAAIYFALNPPTLRLRGPTRLAAAVGEFASPVLLALGTMTRPLPLLLAPVLMWRWSWTQRAVYLGVLLGGIVPLGAAVGFGLFGEPTGMGVFGSTRVYSDSFRFNSAIYQSVEGWLTARSFGGLDAKFATTAFIATIFVSLMALVIVRARLAKDDLALLRLMAAPIGAYLVLSPVVHPWYGLLMVALAVFLAPTQQESWDRWLVLTPWLWLSATLVLSYLTYEDPVAFAERDWVRKVEWWPTLTILVGIPIGLLARHRRLGVGTPS